MLLVRMEDSVMKTPMAALLVAVLAARLLHAQTIELRSGEVLIGRVVEVGPVEIRVEVGFPEPKTNTLPRSDIDPESLYVILAARSDPGSAAAHLALADAAAKMELPAHAIAEYREAARIDPSLKARSEARIVQLRGRIAEDLLGDAREAVEEGRNAAARLLLSTILSKYADTAAGREANRLLNEMTAKASSDGAGKPVTAADAEALLKKVREHLTAADKVEEERAGHGSNKEQRRLERLVAHLESAWRPISNVAGATDNAEISDRVAAVRRTVKTRLVESYLALGTVFVQRRAIPSAETWCEKACDLDPENKENHHLHDIIIQAKITRGWGGKGGHLK